MPETGGDFVGCEAKERHTTQGQEQPLRDDEVEQSDGDDRHPDGQGMSEGDRA
jgi:hypothetical protein